MAITGGREEEALEKGMQCRLCLDNVNGGPTFQEGWDPNQRMLCRVCSFWERCRTLMDYCRARLMVVIWHFDGVGIARPTCS
jgi:hypothetical protein